MRDTLNNDIEHGASSSNTAAQIPGQPAPPPAAPGWRSRVGGFVSGSIEAVQQSNPFSVNVAASQWVVRVTSMGLGAIAGGVAAEAILPQVPVDRRGREAMVVTYAGLSAFATTVLADKVYSYIANHISSQQGQGR